MAGGVNPTTENKQGWLGYIGSTVYKYTGVQAVVEGSCSIAVKTAVGLGKFILTNGIKTPLPVPLQELNRTYAVEEVLKNAVGEDRASLIKNGVAWVINSFVPDKIFYYNGKDLNPLHMKKKTPAAQPSAREVTSQEVPSTRPVNKPSSQAIINQRIQNELQPKNVQKYLSQAKDHAREKLYPVVTNYARAYWLFTSVMGNPLKKGEENFNQALMEVVKRLRVNNKNEFSLSVFKQVLRENGVKISWWQQVKLYLAYPLFGSWITSLIIPAMCNKGIDILYDHLFGEQGKKQEKLLQNSLGQISEFLNKYSQMLEAYKKSTTTKKSEKEFIADLIKSEDLTKLYADFASTIMRNFIPTIQKNLLQPELDRIAHIWGITSNSNYVAKATFFCATLPIRILIWIGWIIDAPIKRIAGSLIRDIGPTITKSVIETLQQPVTQLNIKETLLTELKELKTSLENHEDEGPRLPFSAAKNSAVHMHLQNLAESLSKILAYKTPGVKVDEETILENLIKALNNVGNFQLGDKGVDWIISRALVKVIPQASLTILDKYLHPQAFTEEIFSELVDVGVNSFSPTPDFDEAAKAREKAVNANLSKVINDLSKLAVKNSMEEIIEDDMKQKIPPTLEFTKVSKEVVPSDKLVDVADMVDKSLTPRISRKIQEGISCLFDQNMEQSVIIHAMKIVNSIFGQQK